MKRFSGFLLLLVAAALCFHSCDKGKTYGEKVEEERDMIKQFMSDSSFVVLGSFPSDSVFGSKEFVEYSDGVYLNVVDYGSERHFKTKDLVTVRFTEINLSTGIKISNMTSDNQGTHPDVFRYTYHSSTWQSGYFVHENGNEYPLLMTMYDATAVPAGWLMPLSFLGDGAHVKLIVPHKMGHSDASYYVYPCYYEIKYGLSKR